MSVNASRHPFIEGLRHVPEGRRKELVKIRNWMDSQAHLPEISDEYIYLFLHACYYNIERTKHAIETYFTIRANTPSLFSDRDMYSDKMRTVLELAHLIRLPKATPEGYKVLMYTVRDPDPTRMVFSDAVKGFCMYNDCILSEDGLAEGYIVCFDMKDIGLGHLARVSLPALRAFMVYIQEAHPARLKGIHVLNTAPWINHAMRIVVPLIRSELLNLLKFHKGNVAEGIPVEMMPSDYGGEAPSVKELDAETCAMADKYHKWLLETESFRTDESKRLKKASWWSIFGGSNGSNTNNTVNSQREKEKEILKNLQLD